MGWFSRLTNFFTGPKIPDLMPEGDKKYVEETRTLFYPLDLQSRLPEGHCVYFVARSRSEFFMCPDEWEKGARSIYDSQDYSSIEVEDRSGKVVAAVGWYVFSRSHDTAYTFGTYVAQHLRRRGIAQGLWREMIKRCGKKHINGCAATDEGYTLLTSMKELFPDVVSFDGEKSSFHKDLRTLAKAA